MLIKNVSILLGKELNFISNTNVKIQDSRFKRIQPNIGSSAKEESIDCEGLLLIPGFVYRQQFFHDFVILFPLMIIGKKKTKCQKKA